jgi:hypothetical protein
VHDRQLVAVVVLARDLVVAEHLARRPGPAVRRDPVLVRHVVVVAHDAVVAQRRLAQEEVVLLPGHAVVHQVLVHLRPDPAAVVQVEGQEPPRVRELGGLDRGRIVGVEVLGGLALHEDGVGPDLEDRGHREHVGLHEVLQGRDEPWSVVSCSFHQP